MDSSTKGLRCILARDHFQLPPTIKSVEAEKKGLGGTLFERLVDLCGDEVSFILTVQYCMHELSMNRSSKELYNSKITAHPSVVAHMFSDLKNRDKADRNSLPSFTEFILG